MKKILSVALAVAMLMMTASCKKDGPAPVTGVTLNKTTLTLAVGKAESLEAVIAPTDAGNVGVSWSSSDETIASVTLTGMVTAVGVGTATVTVTTSDGGFEASCIVTVNPVAVTGIKLSRTSTVITVGNSETLVATMQPSNATNGNVIWSSSDEGITSVSQAGKVTAAGVGYAIITVTTEEGGFEATCAVTVTLPPETSTITMTSPNSDVSIYLKGSGPAIIEWGDGGEMIYIPALSDISTKYTYTYADSKPHTIKITGGNITYLNCYNNRLTFLDVSGAAALTDLLCYSNELTGLSVKGCDALNYLDCNRNYMDAKAMDALFGTLNSIAGDKYLFIRDNGPSYNGAGTSGCDRSIAEGSGWSVSD